MKRLRTRIILRVFGCAVLTFSLGASVAWSYAQSAGQRGEPIVGWPMPQTAGELSFLLVALSAAITAAVWVAKSIIAIRNTPTPTHGHAPVDSDQIRATTRTLALIEEQQRTMADLSELTSELHKGMGELTRQVSRVADELERQRKAS